MGVDMSYPSFLRRAVQSESSGFFDIPHYFTVIAPKTVTVC